MAVIDCSGNGVVSRQCNLDMLRKENYQAASQIFRIKGLQCPGEYQLGMAIKRAMVQLSEGKFMDGKPACHKRSTRFSPR